MEIDFQNIDVIKMLGHSAYFLILCSFMVRRILVLRLFAVTASCFSIAYNHQVAGGPLMIPIQWNLVFMAVNIYHLSMALLAKRKFQLEENEEYVYNKSFKSITRVEFKRLLSQGFSRSYHPGQTVVEHNDELGSIFIILEGEAEVRLNGKYVTTLTKGEFIGEMSFLTNQLTKADVIFSQKTKVQYWDLNNLKSFLGRNSFILASFHSAIGNQLISRLIASSERIDQGKDKVAS